MAAKAFTCASRAGYFRPNRQVPAGGNRWPDPPLRRAVLTNMRHVAQQIDSLQSRIEERRFRRDHIDDHESAAGP